MPDSGGKILSKKEIASCFFRPGSGIRTNFKRADDKEPLFPPAWFQVWLFVQIMGFPAKILLLERAARLFPPARFQVWLFVSTMDFPVKHCCWKGRLLPMIVLGWLERAARLLPGG